MSLIKEIALFGPVGRIPIAPGTAAAFVALMLVAFLKPSPALHIALTAVFIIIGTVSSHTAEKLMGHNDPPSVVIDEFAGMLAAMLFLPQSKGYLVAAFILFRVFDILKPPPIMQGQRLPGGWGIMADDLLSAAFTNIVLQIWKRI